jgi:hypothetical protein
VSRLSLEQTQKIESRLREAGAVLPCPRCGRTNSTVFDGFIMEYAQSQLRNMVISGDNRVVWAATVCGGCGYLAQHVMPVLESDLDASSNKSNWANPHHLR